MLKDDKFVEPDLKINHEKKLILQENLEFSNEDPKDKSFENKKLSFDKEISIEDSEEKSKHSELEGNIEDFKQKENDNKKKSDVINIKPKAAKKPAWKKRIEEVLDSIYWTIFFTTLTVYALFSDDLKMIFTTKDADGIFSILTIIVLILFALELVLASIAQDEYFLKFFFWLDFISIFSMLLDIHWVYEAILDAISSENSARAKSAANIAKAGRGARIGSRAIRVLRIMRLIRLVRISKLYKASQQLHIKDKESTNGTDLEMPEESKVGKKLSDLTTKRVIILVLSMIFAIILFNPSFYYDSLSSMDFGIKIFNDFDSVYDPNLKRTFDIYVEQHKQISSPIIYARINEQIQWGDDSKIGILRDSEKIESSDDCTNLFVNTEFEETDDIVIF